MSGLNPITTNDPPTNSNIAEYSLRDFMKPFESSNHSLLTKRPFGMDYSTFRTIRQNQNKAVKRYKRGRYVWYPKGFLNDEDEMIIQPQGAYRRK